MNMQSGCKTRLAFNLRLLTTVAGAVLTLLCSTALYGQQYMRPDGTTGASKIAVSEALPGEYDNASTPDPQYPPGIMPDKALSVDPTSIGADSPDLPPVPSFDGSVNSMTDVLPSAAAKSGPDSVLNLYNAPGSSDRKSVV